MTKLCKIILCVTSCEIGLTSFLRNELCWRHPLCTLTQVLARSTLCVHRFSCFGGTTL